MAKVTDHLASISFESTGRPSGTLIARAGSSLFLPRTRLLAGSTLGLAGAGTALVLVLGAASSPPAYAVTTEGDGSVLVTISQNSALPQANAKLVSMGIHEQIAIEMAPGPAAVGGPGRLCRRVRTCPGRRRKRSVVGMGGDARGNPIGQHGRGHLAHGRLSPLRR